MTARSHSPSNLDGDPVPRGVDRADDDGLVFLDMLYNSGQKAECESNHRLCRYGIGKGESIDAISDQDVLDLFSNVNSYPRESLGWRSPFRAFEAAFPESGGLFEALGFREIPAAQVKFKKK